MNVEQTIRDSKAHLTVLYHLGCHAGFKFFGDDPEEEKKYIKPHHIDMVRDKFGDISDFPWEFLERFYLHSRCLLFPEGVWMSETAGYRQYLRYKPGVHLSFRVSGLTRFTALTNNASAICIGIDPDADVMPNLRRLVHKVDSSIKFMPDSTSSILIPTQKCSIGDRGSLQLASNDVSVIEFEKPGYLIEYMNEPLTVEEAVLSYAEQWYTRRMEAFSRD